MKSNNEDMFGDADWDGIASELKSRTERELHRWRFRGEFGGAVPGGREVEDFIQEAIAEAYTDVARWDVKEMSLLDFLWSLIRLHIKRYGSRFEARKELRATTNAQEATAHVVDVSNTRQTCYQEPDVAVSTQEGVDYILERLRDDRDYRIVEVILNEEVLTPREIAEKLGIEVKEVHNAKKRLKSNQYLKSLARKATGKNRLARKKMASKNRPPRKEVRTHQPDRTHRALPGSAQAE